MFIAWRTSVNRIRTEKAAAERKGCGNPSRPHQTKFVPALEEKIQKLDEAESIGHRSKLELLAAQVGEVELGNIVKIGQAGEHASRWYFGGRWR